MPIRLNLLAEQHAADEVRRRDPVKRATWIVGTVVALLLIWGTSLQIRLFREMRAINRYDADWRTLERDYKTVTSNLNQTAEALQKKAALISLATNRMAWAPMLSALQFSLVDDVQVIHLRTDQSYTLTEGLKPTTNSAGIVSRPKPPTSREKAMFVLEAKDYSAKTGDQIFKFQEKLNAEPYFKTNLQKIELVGRSQPQTDASSLNRPFVQFTLECRYPERVR
ncbi:MAG TPA: hypothetical protein VLU94_03350 [Candidatus Nitrosotalea sp.]|nr:hypothetical protein [Candidatus Nitrosotalea sp.]